MPVLNFKGKSSVYSYHLGTPYRALHIDAKKSLPKKGNVGKTDQPSLDDNLIIHGDNLHALKALLPRYAGKVKCIYIDPPYNTGNEGWKYNDKVNSPLIREWLGKVVDIDDLERHDKWLCMMWPRLHLLKELLSEDGVIFVSIDDNEQQHLKLIMDEIFGDYNYIGTFTWRKKAGAGSDSKLFFRQHEYILFYGKRTAELKELFQPLTEKQKKEYKNPDNDSRGDWASTDLTRADDNDPKRIYQVTSPSGKKYESCWTYTRENFKKLEAENLIWWGKNGDQKPKRKRFLKDKEGLTPRSWIDLFLTSDGKSDLEAIDFERFKHPKPKDLIKLFLEIGSNKNSIILDSFAGSGTTAQAVLDLNKEDGGNRKFILVECEDYADKITAERVRRVIKGVPKAKDEKLKKGLGGSFTYCTLGVEVNEENLIKGKSLPSYEVLSDYVYHVATGQTLDKVDENEDFYIGKTDKDTAFFVIYKPDIKFLRSKESALNLDRAEKIKKIMKQKNCKKAVVFASAHYFESANELAKEGLIFCQLPFAIYRVAGA